MTTSTDVTVDKEELRATMAKVFDVDLAEVTDDAHFIEDLGADSLMTLEAVVVLEKRYPVKLGESDLASVATLDQVYELLQAKLRTRG